MLLLPLRTGVLQSGNDLASALLRAGRIEPGDIIAVSSKAVATVEGAIIELSSLRPSPAAEEWARKTGRSAAFCEAVLQETERLHGKATGHCPGAMVTEVQPEGMMEGSILIANAGLDESNAPVGMAIGWPWDPLKSLRALRERLALSEKRLEAGGSRFEDSQVSSLQPPASASLGVLITDSCLRPRRRGVVACALTVSGFDPLSSQRGRKDLFRKPLRITTEAVADQLSTAANIVMGNAGQGIPAAIIRDHGIMLTDFEGWVPGIRQEEDFFRSLTSSSS